MGKAVGQLWQRHTALLRRVMLHFLPTITSSTFLQEIFAEGKKILSPGTKWFSVWETSQLNAAPRMYLTLKIPSFKTEKQPRARKQLFAPRMAVRVSTLFIQSKNIYWTLTTYQAHDRWAVFDTSWHEVLWGKMDNKMDGRSLLWWVTGSRRSEEVETELTLRMVRV